MKMRRSVVIGAVLASMGLSVAAQNVIVIPATPRPVPPTVNALPSPPQVVVVTPGCGGPYAGAYGYGYGSGAPVIPPTVMLPTPNVVYFGSPYSAWRNYYSGHAVGCYPYSRVVCFGRGEAWERGYWFQHR